MKRRGFTLVEIIIGLVLASLLLAMLSRLLSWGLRSSVKGTAHLSNVQAAAILLGQLEQDIQRARSVQAEPAGSDILRLAIGEEDLDGRLIRPFPEVIYEGQAGRPGLARRRTPPGGSTMEYVFCRGLVVDHAKDQPFFRRVDFPGGRLGVRVCLQVVAPPPGKETFEIERLIFCGNASANVVIPDWQRVD
ncbi:MAG: prepilin-type N-terminal cleavage/methylation domain-containing protein [Candidatus Riflebacteria bacterium]|nr:prepilin-type N-terminal cleavage/methylation domain-containing protein [Candidatus Riflebacteria bacterium]